MYRPQQLSHIVRKGDNLYQLAKYYQTTVPVILSCNPNIDPYNLQVGTQLIICQDNTFNVHPHNITPPPRSMYYKKSQLSNNMRLAWEQHIYWTRMLLISIVQRLEDENDVTNRLLQNPKDIANIFADYYSGDISKTITQLLTEHLQIGAELITALRDQKTIEANKLSKQWYQNADKMAAAFSNINPYYNFEELREMLYSHLKLTTEEVEMRLAKNYPADIEAFNKVEQEALSMADYFTFGIVQQFPQRFY